VLAAAVTCGGYMAREPCCEHPCSIVICSTYMKEERFNSPEPWVQPVLGPVPCSGGICHESLAGLLGSTAEVAPCLSPSWHCASSTADSCRLAGLHECSQTCQNPFLVMLSPTSRSHHTATNRSNSNWQTTKYQRLSLHKILGHFELKLTAHLTKIYFHVILPCLPSICQVALFQEVYP